MVQMTVSLLQHFAGRLHVGERLPLVGCSFPTNQTARANSTSLPHFSHSCARNAMLGCAINTCKCSRDCAYADGFLILVRSGRHCFMHLAASAVELEHRTTTATLSTVHVPQTCDRLQLISKEASSGRTLYAPQAHTLVTAAHCMHLRHTQWSLQHIVQPAITLNSVFTCPLLLSEQTVISTPK